MVYAHLRARGKNKKQRSHGIFYIMTTIYKLLTVRARALYLDIAFDTVDFIGAFEIFHLFEEEDEEDARMRIKFMSCTNNLNDERKQESSSSFYI